MAAERAAPERDVDTKIPFVLDDECGALEALRCPYELIELLERKLERDDGRPD